MMPGVNYVIYGCSSKKATPEVSLIAVIIQKRVLDDSLERQIKNRTLCTWRLFLLT